MKTKELIKFLNQHECFLIREGSNHSIFQNQTNKEVKNNLARKICRDLKIPSPENFQ